MFKRLLSLVLIFLFVLSCASAMESRPVKRFDVIQNEHHLVQVMMTYSDDNAARCVIQLGSGFISLDPLQSHSFSWNSEKREIELRWFQKPFQVPLTYCPSIHPDKLEDGVAYQDEVLLICYASDGTLLHQDRIIITAGFSKMLVEMEPVRDQKH